MIDRFYFRSIYFREPSGVLFEIATLGPGFTVDEPLEHLGEKLSLPPDYEHLRAEVEPSLRPVRQPARRSRPSERELRLARRRPRRRLSRWRAWPQAPQLLAEHGFAAVRAADDPQALAGQPELASAADAVHEVPAARRACPSAAAALLDSARSPHLVALGGGRVIDTAKAVASVTGARVAAIPTTMSGAEMTGIHRLPAGAENRVRGHGSARRWSIADPEAMTSQPERGASGQLDERPRPRRRLPLHAVRQPGLAR